MKKTDKKKLALKTETIRQLLPIELAQVGGGVNRTGGMQGGYMPYTCGLGCNTDPTTRSVQCTAGCPA